MNRLKIIREKKSLTLAQLSARTSIPVRLLGDYEANLLEIPPPHMKALAKALWVKPDELVAAGPAPAPGGAAPAPARQTRPVPRRSRWPRRRGSRPPRPMPRRPRPAPPRPIRARPPPAMPNGAPGPARRAAPGLCAARRGTAATTPPDGAAGGGHGPPGPPGDGRRARQARAGHDARDRGANDRDHAPGRPAEPEHGPTGDAVWPPRGRHHPL